MRFCSLVPVHSFKWNVNNSIEKFTFQLYFMTRIKFCNIKERKAVSPQFSKLFQKTNN